MYCPRCSKEFESGTSYCRTCGLSLEGVAEIVKGEAETEPEIKSAPNENLKRAGLGILILGMMVGLGIPLLKSLGLDPEAEVVKPIFLLLVMLGMLLLGVAVFFPRKRYIRIKGQALSSASENEAAGTRRLEQLPSAERSVDDLLMAKDLREPDSVTEHTTRHLGNPL